MIPLSLDNQYITTVLLPLLLLEVTILKQSLLHVKLQWALRSKTCKAPKETTTFEYVSGYESVSSGGTVESNGTLGDTHE